MRYEYYLLFVDLRGNSNKDGVFAVSSDTERHSYYRAIRFEYVYATIVFILSHVRRRTVVQLQDRGRKNITRRLFVRKRRSRNTVIAYGKRVSLTITTKRK